MVNLTGIIKAAPPRMNPHRSDPVPDLICDGLPGSFRELTEYFGASCRFRRLRPAAVPEHFHQRVLMLPASVRSKAQNLIRSALAYIGVLEANDIALGLCLQMDLAAAEKKVGPGDFLDLLLDLRVLVQQAKIRFRVSRPGQSQ